MKILAIVAIWKRPEVTRACFDALAAVKPPEGYSLDVLVCGSEGEASEGIAREYGYHYVGCDNRPLGNKYNALLRRARDLEWDYLMHLGSDTLVSPGILDLYREVIEREPENPLRLGLRDVWFYDCTRKRFWYFGGYGNERPDSIGCGRMFSRECVERAEYKLWDPTLSKTLDWSAHLRLDALGIAERQAYQENSGEFMVELRASQNVTSLSEFRPGVLQKRPIPPRLVALLPEWALGSEG